MALENPALNYKCNRAELVLVIAAIQSLKMLVAIRGLIELFSPLICPLKEAEAGPLQIPRDFISLSV
jgi:hypothetical protein